jgi:hypothetical protein
LVSEQLKSLLLVVMQGVHTIAEHAQGPDHAAGRVA